MESRQLPGSYIHGKPKAVRQGTQFRISDDYRIWPQTHETDRIENTVMLLRQMFALVRGITLLHAYHEMRCLRQSTQQILHLESFEYLSIDNIVTWLSLKLTKSAHDCGPYRCGTKIS